MDGFAWLAWFDAHDLEVARQVLQRGVAAIALIAFLSALAQFPALLGERGLLPVPVFLRRPYGRSQPTLFRWGYSDRLLRVVAAGGAAVAALLVLGVPQLGPPWVPLLAFLLLYGLYLSIATVGQTFYGFGWESLLLEALFLAAFLGSDQVPPPLPVMLLFAWLVFRLEFGAGMIKMRGGREWRDLTALMYHHETQPMPNPVSRWAHLAPAWFHRLEVLGNHFAQLVVPFFLFFPQPVASVAAAIVILTQAWLVLTGNFAWLNWITIVLAFCVVSDSFLATVLPFLPDTLTAEPAAGSASPLWWVIVVAVATVFFLVLSWQPLRNLFSRHQLMNASFNRWHLVNAYGAFGTVTKRRYEVVVEGTESDSPGAGADWREYEFKGKPGDPARVPRQFAPYHLRLDWLMWFLALGSPDTRWFSVFLTRLLQADRPTLRLLRRDPFAGRPPRWVRARLYLYRFATREERRNLGVVWVRQYVSEVVPPVGGSASPGGH